MLFITSAVAGVLLTLAVRWCAIKNNIVNKPNPIIPQHVKPIAYLGGLAIFLATLLCLIIQYVFFKNVFKILSGQVNPLAAFIISAILFLAWGIYDDIKALKPLPKFAGQLLIAVIAVTFGLHTNLFPFQIIDYLFSVFWIVCIVNAFNFTDVCDGLISGICAVTFLLVAIYLPQFRLFGLLMSGTITGFLFFNWPKASIFLGDAGSHLLGFLIAALCITGSKNLSYTGAVLWMVLLPSVPLFELLFITTIRIKKGLPWYKGSPDHFSLRLQQAGFKRWQVDVAAIIVSSVFVSAACVLAIADNRFKVLLLIVFIIVYTIIWRYLLRWEVIKK